MALGISCLGTSKSVYIRLITMVVAREEHEYLRKYLQLTDIANNYIATSPSKKKKKKLIYKLTQAHHRKVKYFIKEK